MLRELFAALAVALAAPAAPATLQPLTVDQIVAARPVNGIVPGGFSWAPDGSAFVYSVAAPVEKAPPTLRLYRVRDGADRVLFAARSETRGSRSRAIAQVVWSPDSRSLAFVDGSALVVTSLASRSERRIAADVDDPQWSPDSRRIAYVHAGDLYARDVAGGDVTRLTTGGSALVANGDPDWLYSEELDVAHAYAWSPHSDAIAYLRFDDTPVRPFPIEDELARNATVLEQRYPLAGAANPHVSLRIARIGGVARTLYDGAPHDDYVLAPQWTPDGGAVLAQVLDRAQRTKRLLRFGAAGGTATTLVRESDPRFIDYSPAPHVFADGSLLWISTQGARQTLVRIDPLRHTRRTYATGTAIGIERVDATRGVAYVSVREPSEQDRALLRVPLNGAAPTVLTGAPGRHVVTLPDHGSAYIDVFSSLSAPTAVAVRRLDGAAVSYLFRTPSPAAYALGTSRRVMVPAAAGALPAVITVPPNFDPTHRYPVIVEGYAGPLPAGYQRMTDNAWRSMFTHLLAGRGYIVFSIDGPAVADPHRFAGSPGAAAMEPQVAGAAWLRAQPFVDPQRLGLWGWSYGGYLTAFTLEHAPGVFRSGIAGAPVTDWHLYDSAYTERYLGSPQRNAAAYERASTLNHAGSLRASLLVIQGSADDNVHLTNSVSLLQAFIHAGRSAEYMLYPGAQHGPRTVEQRRDLDRRMLAWWQRTL